MSSNNHSNNYKTVRFGDMVHNINERILPEDADGLVYIGLEHLDPESLKIRRWGSPDDVGAQKLRFYAGDIIFGKRRYYQKKLAVAEFDGICSAHAMVLRAKPKIVLPEFLPFFMQSEMFFERAMSISVGSLSPTINWSTLKKQEFPLPPLDEQHRIAEILWAVEDAIEAYTECYKNLDMLLKASSDQLLTTGYDNSEIVDFEEIIIPKHWDFIELADLIDVSHGYAFKSQYFSDTALDCPVLITPGNFAVDGGLYFTKDNTKYYEGEIPDDFILQPGDLITVMTDLSKEAKILGNPAFIGSEKVYLQNQRIGKIVYLDQERLIPDFLYFVLLGSRFQNRIKATASGSTVSHTSPSRIREVKIPLPPTYEQKKIAFILKEIDENRRRYRQQIESTRLLGKKLNNDFLS